jgi:hypothetical protein
MSLAVQHARRLEAAGAWGLTEVRGRAIIDLIERTHDDVLGGGRTEEAAAQWRLLLDAVTEVIALMWAPTLPDELEDIEEAA